MRFFILLITITFSNVAFGNSNVCICSTYVLALDYSRQTSQDIALPPREVWSIVPEIQTGKQTEDTCVDSKEEKLFNCLLMPE